VRDFDSSIKGHHVSRPIEIAAVAEEEISADASRIRKNALLHEIYLDVYRRLMSEVPSAEFPRTLELGSGGGFLKEIAPHVLTSECVAAARIDRVVDACCLQNSFGDESLDAIVAFNVLHHLPDIAAFLRGASRVLRKGGRIAAIEPWFTPVGQWFYRALHHEPVVNDPSDWSIRGEGRLAGANSRLPTSVFRDNDERFGREFPGLVIRKRTPFHKWLYLLSGGLRLNTRIPRTIARPLVALDRRVGKGDATFGIFGVIVVDRCG
jgi:SAM-dependent methyltransferase